MDEKILRIDFETRSAVDLKKCGAFKYASDKSTTVLCMAYQMPGEKVQLIDSGNLPREVQAWIINGGVVESHNAEFEYCIWNYHCVPQLKWPPLNPKQLRCSAAKAAALALPRSLANLSEALELPIKKDSKGHRIMLRLSKPRKPKKGEDPSRIYWNEYHDNVDEYRVLYNYCITDVEAESLASKIIPPLSNREENLFRLTLVMNRRGVYCDTELCKKAVEFSEEYQKDLLDELKILTDGQVKTAKQIKKLKEWIEAESPGITLETLNSANVDKALELKDISSTARRALEIRKALSKSSVSKMKSMLAMAGDDKRIRGTFLYCGASRTGRFAGRGIQPQNYVRIKKEYRDYLEDIYDLLKHGDYDLFKTMYSDVFTALSQSLRGMLRASPGKTLFISDFSAIEARVVLWLASDEENLNVYRTNADPYKEMASVIYSTPVSMVTKDQRELGKRAVLGCSYGMSHHKFHQTCATQGFPIPASLAEKAVRAYRKKYARVVSYWYDMERAAIAALLNPGRRFKANKVTWFKKDRSLFCELPSGRCLSYFDPEIREEASERGVQNKITFMNTDSLSKKWLRGHTYSSKLVENITQAVARDVMAESMVRTERNGFPLIMTVHDEIVAEVDKGKSLMEFEKSMSEVPSWAKGLPLKVESFESERYVK